MAKFRLLHEQLLRQGLAVESQIHQPLPAPRRWLELVDGRTYHQAFARGELGAAAERRIGLPATTPLVRRTWLAVGGTVLTARLALHPPLRSPARRRPVIRRAAWRSSTTPPVWSGTRADGRQVPRLTTGFLAGSMPSSRSAA